MQSQKIALSKQKRKGILERFCEGKCLQRHSLYDSMDRNRSLEREQWEVTGYKPARCAASENLLCQGAQGKARIRRTKTVKEAEAW